MTRLAFCSLFWLTACPASAPSPLAEVTQASAAHLHTFARLERWTERMGQSDVRLRGKPALREAMFAPFRAEPAVLWADVRAADSSLSYETPLDAAQLRYVSVEAPALGRLLVALVEDCSPRRAPAKPARKPSPPRACVVLARPPSEEQPNGLRVAFRRAEADANNPKL